MESKSISLMFFLTVFLLYGPDYNKFSLGFVCKERERQALLSFGEDLNYQYTSYLDENENIHYEKMLSTWDGKECCNWTGVVCNPKTGNVVELHLQELSRGGNLNSSLLELKHLYHLNLSFNEFEDISIPSFLGSLHNLRYLDLHSAGFGGLVPQELGNLSNLYFLDISINDELDVGDLQWLSHLSSLQHLDLRGMDLSRVSHKWLHVINMLPSLVELRLAYCNLDSSTLPTLPHINFTSLSILDLSYNYLNSSLLPAWLYNLTRLEELDLSSNNFYGTISKDIGYLTSIKSLDLTWNQFHGPISKDIGYLTSMKRLQLGKNHFEGEIPASLYNLTRLEELDLSSNKFHGAISEDIGYLTSMKRLQLSGNKFEGEIPSTLGNLCKLQMIDLSYCELHGDISGFLVNSSGCITSSLKTLCLSDNKLSGPLPEQLGKLQNLEILFLYNNSFSGSIPSSLGRLSLLRDLLLDQNKLNGSLPETIGNLSSLETFIISDNKLQGVVTEVHFANLRRLNNLEIDSVYLKLSSASRPPFQLERLSCSNCHIGPGFPQWLKTQKKIAYIDLSNTRISGMVPSWFWDMSSQMNHLNLAQNRLTGEFPKFLNMSFSSNVYANLSSNHFNGPLPHVSNVAVLDLSHNSLSGPISSFRCHPEFGEVDKLSILDLSYNALSGEIPECWFNSSSLLLLKLESNKLTGKIPSSIGSLLYLQSLHLGNNSLSGELPQSLRNCTNLIAIDLSENKFSGSISTWLRKDFAELILLKLRVNKFSGSIPEALCNLTYLRILDIADNNLSGLIPRCFGNLSAMALKQEPMDDFSISINGLYYETASLVTKGIQYEYSKTLRLVTMMDLSTNNLTGEIPHDLTTLHELRYLSLSENHFTGKIPDEIGKMSTLESLDFSSNNLSGVIPQSIADLHSLNRLNLSYNNLSGKIPTGSQLQTFTELSYVGNIELCGIPLNNCNEQAEPPAYGGGKQDVDGEDDDDWLEMKWFYISAGVGFVTGFWGFCGVLLWKQSWRHAYFRFITSVTQKLFSFCAW